jgi:hypothetical protein
VVVGRSLPERCFDVSSGGVLCRQKFYSYEVLELSSVFFAKGKQKASARTIVGSEL